MSQARALRIRPNLYTSYAADMALLNTPSKRLWSGLIVGLGALLPLLVTDDLLLLLGSAWALAVGAIGLNLVTGYAGQVSLGHAFFVGLGAYTAAILSGDPEGRTLGLGLPMIVWLPAAALVPGLAGAAVAPLATRLRGLYLAIVTLGLVFVGEHLFEEATTLTGGASNGRAAVEASVFGVSLVSNGELLSRQQKSYWFAFILLVVLGVLARNLARSAVGRAFSAVRDRDIAAEVIGVRLSTHKLLAFVVSSAYAGVSGAVLYTVVRTIQPQSFNLLLSVLFIAMVLIGGAATITGSVAGALFITGLGRVTSELSRFHLDWSIGPIRIDFDVADFIPVPGQPGGLLNNADLATILYGLLIIGFLIFEPRGLFGIWIRIRNYWKGWPFTY